MDVFLGHHVQLMLKSLIIRLGLVYSMINDPTSAFWTILPNLTFKTSHLNFSNKPDIR